MSDALRKMMAGEFSRRLRKMCEHPDSRFAFFLGAGCSVSSGVPDTASVVKSHWLPRLRDLRNPERRDLDTWAQEQFPEYDPEHPEVIYGELMRELFLMPEERQREIEALCESKFPGFGYAVLAGLMTMDNARFNVVLTTNFDDLIPESLALFTQARPIVTPLESIGNYLRPTRTRPLVVKLHGDHRLAPLNTMRPVGELTADVEKRVRGAIRDRGLIFIGYRGNDESLARMLGQLTEEALPLGVFWVSDDEPTGLILSWLESRQAIWVRPGDFDQTMLLLRNVFTLPHPDSKRFEHVFGQYAERYQNLSQKIGAMEADAPGADALKQAVRDTDNTFPDWWAVELEAERLKHTEPGKADTVYAKGIEQFPNCAPLMGSYATFLRDFRKDNVRAEDFYQKAITVDPNNIDLLQNYGFFLARVRKDFDRAEECYAKALAVEPQNARLMATMASFLAKMKRDAKRAEDLYRKAVAADETDPYLKASYAGFLLAQGRDEEGMELLSAVLPKSASDETPNLALETWFYLLAHGPAESRSKTLSDLKRALKSGRRRPGLVLLPNVAKARQAGHPDSTWLEKLAAVINEEASLTVLDDWPVWKQIG